MDECRLRSGYTGRVEQCTVGRRVVRRCRSVRRPQWCHRRHQRQQRSPQFQRSDITANLDPAACLAPAQVQTVRWLTTDFTLSNGSVVYSRYNWTTSWAKFAPSMCVLGGGFAMIATGDLA